MVPRCRDDVPEAICKGEEAWREAVVNGAEPVVKDLVQADGSVSLDKRGGGLDLEDGLVQPIVDGEAEAALLPLKERDP